jgi:hypothetical protein
MGDEDPVFSDYVRFLRLLPTQHPNKPIPKGQATQNKLIQNPNSTDAT